MIRPLLLNIAKDVHRNLGPGMSEAIYHRAMEVGLRNRNIPYQSETIIPVTYNNYNVGNVRSDLLVQDCVVELKAVKNIQHIHRLQVETYMNLLNMPSGLILNFGSQELETIEIGYGVNERPSSA
jgi:GxxExxY protein